MYPVAFAKDLKKQNVVGTAGSVNSLTGSKQKNDNIIPDRRRKYLANASDDNQGAAVAQQMMGVENHELYDSKAFHQKNNKKNIHL